MGNLAAAEIQTFLQRLSERYTEPTTIFLLGGGALCMLGSPRRTVDIDYAIANETSEKRNITRAIDALANEMKIELEIVPIEEFVPLPQGAQHRHVPVGKFGNLTVYVYDPYTIALSKVSRGFEADLQDVIFLLGQGIIELDELAQYVEDAMPRAWEFDIDPQELRLHLGEIRRLNK